MNKIEFGEWLVTQSDRGLFIMALLASGWMFWRVLKRSERQTDQMVSEMRESRKQHHERMNSMHAQVFENSQRVTDVVATAVITIQHNTRILEKLENKL